MDKRFIAEMAEILELDERDIQPGLELNADHWNSLAIVSTIALSDELYGVLLNGQALGRCKVLADVISLIEKGKAKQ